MRYELYVYKEISNVCAATAVAVCKYQRVGVHKRN